MALVIPNIEDAPAFDGQTIFDATDLAALLAAVDGYGTGSGDGTVTPNTGTDMAVQTGFWFGIVPAEGPLQVVVLAQTDIPIAAANATDRRDIVVVSYLGVISVVQGTPCTVANWNLGLDPLPNPPVKPAIPGASVILAEVYVQAGCTAITSANITDKTAASSAVTPTGVVNLTATNATQNYGIAQVNVAPEAKLIDQNNLVSSGPSYATDFNPLQVVAAADLIQVAVDAHDLFLLADFFAATVAGTITVWDQSGTNLLAASFSVPGLGQPAPSLAPAPLALVQVLPSSGSDLSITEDGLSITSAAGGVYNVLINATAVWDDQ